jgi:DGQHR domain-containing protein
MPGDENDDVEENVDLDVAPSVEAESPFEFEDRFRRLLSDMGLSDVDGGRAFVLGGQQIDACGGIQDHLLIFDCTIKRGNRATTKQLRNKITLTRGKAQAVADAAKVHPIYGRYTAISFVIAANTNVSETDLKYGLQDLPVVHILNRQNIEYLTEIADDIGPYSRFRLAGLLELPIRRTSSTVPAIRILERGKSTYVFAAESRDLAELAFVPQAEAGFKLFYQRLIRKGKIRSISEYVVGHARPFPNSVVLASNREPEFAASAGTPPGPQSEQASIQVGSLALPQTYGAFWVVDGQHRIFGSALSTKPPVLVATLVPATDLEKARYFLDINSDQTKINSDLKWDLRARLIPDQPEGRISSACQRVDSLDGPLRGRIKIPHLGVGRSRPIKLSGLCDAVLKNRLHETHQYKWSEDDFVKHLSDDLNSWFGQIDAAVENQAFKKHFLLDNSGLSVLTIVFKRISKKEEHKRPTLALIGEYAKALSEWVANLGPSDASSLAKRCSSEGGRAEVADLAVSAMNEKLSPELHLELTGPVSRLSDEIKEFEKELRQGLNATFTGKIGASWIDQCGLGQTGRPAPTWDGLTLGQLRSVLTRGQFWAACSHGFDAIGMKQDFALGLFDYVIGYRNATEHGRLSDAKKFDLPTAAAALRSLRKGFGLR